MKHLLLFAMLLFAICVSLHGQPRKQLEEIKKGLSDSSDSWFPYVPRVQPRECHLAKAFLNDSLVIRDFKLDKSKDTIILIDNYYYFSWCEPFVTSYGRAVVFDRHSSLNLDRSDLSDSEKWKNTLWILHINDCGNEHSLEIFWKYFNMGGSITYSIEQNEIKRVKYSIGSY
jgi:hypothetical protein